MVAERTLWEAALGRASTDLDACWMHVSPAAAVGTTAWLAEGEDAVRGDDMHECVLLRIRYRKREVPSSRASGGHMCNCMRSNRLIHL